MNSEYDWLDGFLTVLWYNGHEDEIKRIFEYVDKYEEFQIPYPDFLSEDCDSPERLLWSFLVYMFGDYGTSPRFGWLYKEGTWIEAIKEWIEEIDATP